MLPSLRLSGGREGVEGMRAAGHQRGVAKSHPDAGNGFFFFNIPRENENGDIHTHERPCTGSSAFPFEKEIENIPRLIFFR